MKVMNKFFFIGLIQKKCMPRRFYSDGTKKLGFLLILLFISHFLGTTGFLCFFAVTFGNEANFLCSSPWVRVTNRNFLEYCTICRMLQGQARGFAGTLSVKGRTLLLLHPCSQWLATVRNISWFMALSINFIRDCGHQGSNLPPQDY